MKKFAFIGAGSFIFTRNLVRDLLSFPAFADCELALMDTDPERLERITAAVRKINAAMGTHATITPTQSRAEALSGADGVLCTVFNGGIDVWRYDIEIPMQFGVDINIGDTRSVSGIFRALRNIPLMLDICRDIEKYCPNAVFLNYTNPMSMLCKAMQTETNVEVTGLCHSVQGTVTMLAEWLETPVDEINYLCAGVNHQGAGIALNQQRNGAGKDLNRDRFLLIGRIHLHIRNKLIGERLHRIDGLHLLRFHPHEELHDLFHQIVLDKSVDKVKPCLSSSNRHIPADYVKAFRNAQTAVHPAGICRKIRRQFLRGIFHFIISSFPALPERHGLRRFSLAAGKANYQPISPQRRKKRRTALKRR